MVAGVCVRAAGKLALFPRKNLYRMAGPVVHFADFHLYRGGRAGGICLPVLRRCAAGPLQLNAAVSAADGVCRRCGGDAVCRAPIQGRGMGAATDHLLSGKFSVPDCLGGKITADIACPISFACCLLRRLRWAKLRKKLFRKPLYFPCQCDILLYVTVARFGAYTSNGCRSYPSLRQRQI